MQGASGVGMGRKQSTDTASMAFDANEEMKESMALESLDDRGYMRERKSNVNIYERNTSGTRRQE